MREREVFSALRLVPGTWCVLRLDGRAFGLFTAARYTKPFDESFRDAMVLSAGALMEDFGAAFGSVHSDEMSIVLLPEWDQFGRRIEKILSIASGVVSAAFTHAVGEPAHFDGRIWQAATESEVAAYFRWRQEDAEHCALHAWCYWTLCSGGLEAEAAQAELEGKGRTAQLELLSKHGINFDEVPAWQRRGVALYHAAEEKEGYNPVTHAQVKTLRRILKQDLDLPAHASYEIMVRSLLQSARSQFAVHPGSLQ